MIFPHLDTDLSDAEVEAVRRALSRTLSNWDEMSLAETNHLDASVKSNRDGDFSSAIRSLRLVRARTVVKNSVFGPILGEGLDASEIGAIVRALQSRVASPMSTADSVSDNELLRDALERNCCVLLLRSMDNALGAHRADSPAPKTVTDAVIEAVDEVIAKDSGENAYMYDPWEDDSVDPSNTGDVVHAAVSRGWDNGALSLAKRLRAIIDGDLVNPESDNS